jgi:hypothetical protein
MMVNLSVSRPARFYYDVEMIIIPACPEILNENRLAETWQVSARHPH